MKNKQYEAYDADTFEIDWDCYPALASAFQHRPRENKLWLELTKLVNAERGLVHEATMVKPSDLRPMREAMAKALRLREDQLPGFEATVYSVCSEVGILRARLEDVGSGRRSRS